MLKTVTCTDRRSSFSVRLLALALALAMAVVVAPAAAAAQTLTINVPMREITASGLVVAPGGALTVTVGPVPAACAALGSGDFSESLTVVVPPSGPNTVLESNLGFGTSTAVPVTTVGEVGLGFSGRIADVAGRDACIASTTPVELAYTPRPDTTAPTASPTVGGQQGSNGWYTGPVTVTWHWADNQGGSGLSSTCPATSTYSAPDSATASLGASCADIAGNTGTSSVSFQYDATTPTITAQLNPAQAASTGWYNQANGAPTVSFTCTDATSGIPAGTCPTAHTFSDGASQSYTASVKDNAGNSASAGVTAINVDLTAPTVTYAGNAATYTVDQQVTITCTASDATSGVVSSTCQSIGGAASSFGLGTHTYAATATDQAGNTGKGTTSFTVTVTPSSLQTLINRFCTDPSVAASLNQDVTNILSAPNARAKAGALQAFTSLAQAQTGKSLTSTQANTLITLAHTL